MRAPYGPDDYNGGGGVVEHFETHPRNRKDFPIGAEGEGRSNRGPIFVYGPLYVALFPIYERIVSRLFSDFRDVVPLTVCFYCTVLTIRRARLYIHGPRCHPKRAGCRRTR